MLRAKLSVLLRSRIPQKAGDLPIHGKSRSTYTSHPVSHGPAHEPAPACVEFSTFSTATRSARGVDAATCRANQVRRRLWLLLADSSGRRIRSGRGLTPNR